MSTRGRGRSCGASNVGRCGLTDSFAGKVWDKLSRLDVGEHVEKKGRYSYLSWVWAWATLMKHYPESQVKHELVRHEGGTAEINTTVTVKSGDESFERSMWLAVMDHRHSPIKNPDAAAINNTKMRCLVKALAFTTGLGLYIFAGEDVPATDAPPPPQDDDGKRLSRLSPPQDDDAQESGKLIQRMREQAEILAGNIPEEAKKLSRGTVEDKRRAVAILDAVIDQDSNQTQRRNGKPWEAYGGAS